MSKFIVIVVQLSIVILFASFIIANPFIVSFEISDFIFSIPSSYFFVLFIIFFLLIFLIQTTYLKIKFNYSNFKISSKFKKKEKGYNSFVSGMIALSNKDYKKLLIESKNVSKYLESESSLSMLLKSELLKVNNNLDELSLIYEKMSKNQETKNMAYRGLMEQYLRAQDYHHAFLYGEKLFINNPNIEKIYDTLVNVIAKTNNWQQLVRITDIAFSKKLITKKIYEENKSIAFFEISKIKKYNDIKESINLMIRALKLRKNFPPFITLYLNLLLEDKQYNLAKKFIKKIWNENPHSKYIIIIRKMSILLNLSMLDLSNYVISSKNTDLDKILLVESSIDSKDWDNAKQIIRPLIDVKPKKNICLLMARIEEGLTGDIQKVNSWKYRANTAAEDEIWVCLISNQSQNEWASVSNAGYFNALQWKKPIMLNNSQIIERS